LRLCGEPLRRCGGVAFDAPHQPGRESMNRLELPTTSGRRRRIPRRGVLAAVTGLVALALALLVAAGAGASFDTPTLTAPTIPDNTYLFGPHQGADSTTFNHEGDCSGLTDGQVLWHFVLPQ